MKYASLIALTGALECFDLPLLVQGTDERRDTLRVQLSRWMKEGKVIGLRRGMYTLPDTYRRVSVSPPHLANELYRPSYLSTLWALGFYDLIPERVVRLTSVTTRVPRTFGNPFGFYDYRNIKRGAFFGYVKVPHDGCDIRVAEPEKALLDHWHLTPGEWTEERLAEMRYQNVSGVSTEQLQRYVVRFKSPRLERATDRWCRLVAEDSEGTVAL